MFKIIGDSTFDLTKELRAKYDIDYCKMGITCDDKEYVADLDYVEYTPKILYGWMRDGKRVFTNQVPEAEFKNIFTKYLDQGFDVLYISCSSALSASYNASLKVREELLETYKDRKIICVDSLISCIGQGSMCIKAALLRDEGKTIEEVEAWLLANRLKFNQFCSIDTLEFLRKAGRVKAAKAFFGDLFGIKPILVSDVKGRNYAFKKAKGRIKSLDEVARLTVEALENNYEETIYIGNADCVEDAIFLVEKIKKLDGNYTKFEIVDIGPIIGASTGPGTISTFVFGKEVTIDEESSK